MVAQAPQGKGTKPGASPSATAGQVSPAPKAARPFLDLSPGGLGKQVKEIFRNPTALDLSPDSLDKQAKGNLRAKLAEGHQRNQYRIALLIVVLFSAGFFAALAVIGYTIVVGKYQESYLTLLSTIGVLWGSVIGSVAGFYFAKQSGEDGF